MSRELDQKVRDHFAKRDETLEVTPFTEIFSAANANAHPTKWHRLSLSAVAASILVVGLAAVLWNAQETTSPPQDAFFAELTRTTVWRAPSDRLTAQATKLSALQTPRLNWPETKVTRLGAFEEIKL